MRTFHACLLAVLLAPVGAYASSSITSAAEVDAMAHQLLSYQITANNAPTSFTVSGLSSITGLALDKVTGVISGTPTVVGTFNVTVNAKGTGGTASKKIVFVISKEVVQFTSASSTSGALNTSFSFQLTVGISNATYSASDLPPGLKIGGSSGLITGTPTSPGVYAPSVSASTKTQTASQLLLIVINGGTAAPSALAITPSSGTVGVPYNGAVTAKGSPPITITITSPLPAGLTSNGNLISGTPTTAGVTPVNMTASNTFGTVTTTINFAISQPNGTPIISSPLAVTGEVEESFSYKIVAAGKTPLKYTVDATKLPRGLALNGDTISGYPFDSGVFNTPLSVSNTVGADNEILTITIAPLAVGNTNATIKFSDGYKDVNKQGNAIGTSSFQFTATVNTPGIDPTQFSDKLSFDVTVGLFEFSGTLGDAVKGGRFTPGKSAKFVFTDSRHNLGGIMLSLGKGNEVKITCRRKGTDLLGGVETLHAEQLAGSSQLVSEMIPLKIQIGNSLAAFYVQANGPASVKQLKGLKLSTVKLKGFGNGSPVQ